MKHPDCSVIKPITIFALTNVDSEELLRRFKLAINNIHVPPIETYRLLSSEDVYYYNFSSMIKMASVYKIIDRKASINNIDLSELLEIMLLTQYDRKDIYTHTIEFFMDKRRRDISIIIIEVIQAAKNIPIIDTTIDTTIGDTFFSNDSVYSIVKSLKHSKIEKQEEIPIDLQLETFEARIQTHKRTVKTNRRNAPTKWNTLKVITIPNKLRNLYIFKIIDPIYLQFINKKWIDISEYIQKKKQ